MKNPFSRVNKKVAEATVTTHSTATQQTQQKENEGAVQQTTPEVQKSLPWFVKFIMWFAFCAFLATSIPHVAWLYHTFEQGETASITIGAVTFDFWWLMSYSTAIGIDLTVACLAYLLEIGIHKTGTGIVWLFTGLLGALSWYANYLYTMAHDPVHQTNIWDIQLLFGVTTGFITPIIISAVPAFVIAYTFMIQVVGNQKKLTASELAAQATEIEQMNAYKARIRAARQQALVSSVTGIVDSATTILHHTKDVTITPVQAAQEPLQIAENTVPGPQPQIAQAVESVEEVALSDTTKQHASDKLEITIEALRHDPNITDETLASILHLERPASARFWKIKAIELLNDASPLYHRSNTTQPVVNTDNLANSLLDLPGYIVVETEATTLPELQTVSAQNTGPIVTSNGHTDSLPVYRRKKKDV